MLENDGQAQPVVGVLPRKPRLRPTRTLDMNGNTQQRCRHGATGVEWLTFAARDHYAC